MAFRIKASFDRASPSQVLSFPDASVQRSAAIPAPHKLQGAAYLQDRQKLCCLRGDGYIGLVHAACGKPSPSMAPPTAEIELVNNYVRFVCIAAFAYDWVLTFGDEVNYIWGMKWRGSKILFMLLRYVTLIQMAMTALDFLNFSHSVNLILSYLSTGLEAVIFCIVQVLLQLRIYIVYNRSRKILWSNVGLFLVEIIVTALLFVKTASEIKDVPVTPTQRCHTCSIYPSTMGLCFVAPLLFETYLLILMLRMSWSNREILHALADAEGHSGSILDVLIRGSVLYFLLVASGMAVSITAFFAAPRYALWTDLVSGSTGCIGGTRLIISMRRAQGREDNAPSGTVSSKFAARPGPGSESYGGSESVAFA